VVRIGCMQHPEKETQHHHRQRLHARSPLFL